MICDRPGCAANAMWKCGTKMPPRLYCDEHMQAYQQEQQRLAGTRYVHLMIQRIEPGYTRPTPAEIAKHDQEFEAFVNSPEVKQFQRELLRGAIEERPGVYRIDSNNLPFL